MNYDTANAAQLASISSAMAAERDRANAAPQTPASETFLSGLSALARRDATVWTVTPEPDADAQSAQAA